MRQDSREWLATFHIRLAPDILLHSFRARHPRTTGLAPSWRTCNSFFHPELVGEGGGVLECVFPFGSHVDQSLIDDLRCLQCCIEVLKSAQADTMHPLQIQLDSFLRDVAVHPVPPDPRTSIFRWTLESGHEWIGSDLRLRTCDCNGEKRQRCNRLQGLMDHCFSSSI